MARSNKSSSATSDQMSVENILFNIKQASLIMKISHDSKTLLQKFGNL